MKTLRKHVIMTLLLLAMIPAIFALESTLTLQGGVGVPLDDWEGAENVLHGAWGISWDLWFKESLAVGINPYFTTLQVKDAPYRYTSSIEGLDLYLKLRPTKTLTLNFDQKAIINRISPFIAAGVGYAHHGSKGLDHIGALTENDKVNAYMAVLPNAALGVSMLTKWNTTLDLGLKLDYTNSDEITMDALGDLNDAYMMPYVGIGIHFGGTKDKDGDGIPDRKDKAPRDPEDFDGYMDDDGAPDLDNDGDGILDIYDKAPNDPEDKDGFMDNDGAPDPDNDNDGIPDVLDKAPNQAEDKDGYMDNDGVPDPDNDNDGILDINDKAPNDPEDIDSFQDNDGIPDPDNDGDGIPDINDKAPGTDETVRLGTDTKENYNGYQDEDGVPDVLDPKIKDKDGDGIPDDKDKAPNDPEDKDGYLDNDGAPDPDNDNDGVLDKNDKAPGTDETVRQGINTKETYNDFEDTDGVPDTAPQAVLPDAEFDVPLPVAHFETNYYNISAADKLLLDVLAEGLKKFPQVKLQVQGHTDSTGPAAFNEKLAVNRAQAVKNYLVGKGIAASRLEVKGFGPSKPADTNDTAEGRANNRRVDFIILK